MIATPTEIQYFIEVYQTKHVTRAAQRLGVTQPTLTQSLKSLEDKLGAKLFLRTKQGVVPLKSAHRFHQSCKLLNEHWSAIKNDIAQSETELVGQFIVGCHPSVGAYTAPLLLKRLTEKAPGLSIQFVHDFSKKIVDKIVSYEADIGYVVNPTKHPDLVFKKIGDDRVSFWKSDKNTEIPRRIFIDGGRRQHEDLLEKTLSTRFKGWQVVNSSNLELVRTLISQGQGIGILPERVATAESRKLVLFDKALPFRHDEIYLAYRKETMATVNAKYFLELASIQL